MGKKNAVPTAGELARFRDVQQLAYRCVETIAGELQPGITEKDTTDRMRRWLIDHGVDDWFHLPFAWFGDRSAFQGFRIPLQFFPTGRELEEDMPFILDCAPVVGGFMADIGYASCLGENLILDRILDDLAAHRALILELVRDRRTFREIYEKVDQLILRQGYENRHRAYPGKVLAHRVWRLSPRESHRTLGRFGTRSLRRLGRTALVGASQGRSPLWNGSRFSDHRPLPGLWAVEPHLGFRGVGAKFEELLVITDDDAYWLDDDLPHVRRWAARGVTATAGTAA
jgi:Xaa-Pro aminopeptidase